MDRIKTHIIITLLYQTMCLSAADPSEKKAEISASCTLSSAVNQELLRYCTRDTVNLIRDYCGSAYAFAAYSNNDCADYGEEITRVRMSPGEVALAVCSENTVAGSSSLSILRTDNGEYAREYLGSHLLISDVAWAHDLSSIAISFGPRCEVVEKLGLSYDEKKFNEYRPKTYTNDGKTAYYALETYNEKRKPIISVVVDDESSPISPVYAYSIGSLRLNSPHPVSDAVLLTNKKLFAFCKADKTACVWSPLWESKVTEIQEVESVDVSLPNPILGKSSGAIQCWSLDGARINQVLHAFEGNPIDAVAASPTIIAALSHKTIRAMCRKTGNCIMEHEHKSAIIPSILKVAPDGRHLAYAAGKSMRILSLQPEAAEREVQYHVFDQPISWMHWAQDNGIHIAYGGTITKLLPE